MTIDMSKYLGIFVTEATEHLEALGRDLVQLEREVSAERVDSMFRHAHSVKGMAASMGFEATARLSHRVEDLVDALRRDPTRFERGLVDLLLAATDALTSHVKVAAGGVAPEDDGVLERRLGEKVLAMTGQAVTPTRVANAVVEKGPEEGRAGAAAAPETRRFSVRVRIAQSCAVPSVRAFLVHKRLALLGKVHEIKPSLEDVKAGRIPDGLVTIELDSAAGEGGIGSALKSIAEVEVLAVAPAAQRESTPEKHAVPGGQPSPAPSSVGADAARMVRVRAELLDVFMDTAGELLLATAQLREVSKAVPESLRPRVDERVDRVHALVKGLHDNVMKARMTPLSNVTDRLPRAARDIARKRDKEVELVIEGAEVELDRAIVDELSDPLLHLLRNCIDHGVEQPSEREALGKLARGRISIGVRRGRDGVVIEIQDDGRGMNPEKLKSIAVSRGFMTSEAAARLSPREALMLACLPGLSTAADVTEISGRGVGMDAVKRSLEAMGGTLDIESIAGKGTRFLLKLPLTVAVVQLLLVAVGEEVFGLPVAKVRGVLEIDPQALSRSRDSVMLPHGAGLLPVFELSELLGVPPLPRIGPRSFVVMDSEQGRVALGVDALVGQEEVVLKALGRPLDLVPGLAGVSILGSGRPVFILDVPRLLVA